jgi:hypothetical protein
MKFRERKKGRRKKNKEAQLMTKTKERQRKVTSQAKHKLHTENSRDRCWSVDSRFGVLLRSRVRRLSVGS